MTVTRSETVPTALGDMAVSLSLPETERPAAGFPGVVVIHEIFGLKPEIVAVAERFAARGWAAAAPDLFSTGSTARCVFRAMREVSGRTQGPVTAQLDAARAWLPTAPRSTAQGWPSSASAWAGPSRCCSAGPRRPGCGR